MWGLHHSRPQKNGVLGISEDFLVHGPWQLPSGELTFCHGKIHHAIFMGTSTISMAMASIAFCEFTRPGMQTSFLLSQFDPCRSGGNATSWKTSSGQCRSWAWRRWPPAAESGFRYGYGSNTYKDSIFSGMKIHKSQLF